MNIFNFLKKGNRPFTTALIITLVLQVVLQSAGVPAVSLDAIFSEIAAEDFSLMTGMFIITQLCLLVLLVVRFIVWGVNFMPGELPKPKQKNKSSKTAPIIQIICAAAGGMIIAVAAHSSGYTALILVAYWYFASRAVYSL